jgi:6-carboxyhexanoate--CoA ligase
MSEALFSVRMRASCRGQHISGAERIVKRSSVGVVSNELLSRALTEGHLEVDELHCTAEIIDQEQVRYEQLPDITTCEVDDCIAGRASAARLLSNAGVDIEIAKMAVQLLAAGAAPGGKVMRGAVLMDMKSGERLETDPARGVRVSRMDLVENNREEIIERLAAQGLGHHRVCEALVLAGKVMHAPGIVAELCWSDAPDYLTGYVCSSLHGYQRITKLKSPGEKTGGRVFFVDRSVADLNDLVAHLECQPVLFETLGDISADEGPFADG